MERGPRHVGWWRLGRGGPRTRLGRWEGVDHLSSGPFGENRGIRSGGESPEP